MKKQKKFEGRYEYENLENKLSAIVLLACGYVGIPLENDATALVFMAMFAIPLFFAKENWIY